ncbi:MAG: DNA (cytosine-5-)-methyltransferase [Pseudaminobacter sp.]
MRYGSVCSGIEAATMAWHPLGWSPAYFSEIEKFPSAVLAHHYPAVPNLGDMTKYEDWPDDAIDLLVGGTPCQSFSVAGLRQGLADPRGNLMLTYLAIARRYQPRWLVWENVPGVLSSNGGRDFGTFIRGLEECGYHAAWRVLDAQFVRVDGFARAVPQRRRRVFVVGYLGDWRRAAAVLLERESLRWDSAPRRQAGQGVAPTISARPTGGGGLGTDFDCDGGLIPSAGAVPVRGLRGGEQPDLVADLRMVRPRAHADEVARCVTAGYAQRLDWETENFIATRDVAATLTRGAESAGKGGYAGRRREDDDNLVAHTLLAKSNDSHAADLDTYVPYTLAIRGRGDSHNLEYRQDGTANAILTPNGGRAGIGVGAIAFDTTQITSKANYSRPEPGDPCHPLAAGAHAPAIAWSIMPQNSGKDFKARSVDVAQPLMAGGPVGGNQGGDYIQERWAVRRLTPRECERLQGFPDNFTDIQPNGKPTPDGPRYKALGNSMAVNVMRWIGRRIEHVERLVAEIEAQEAAA